MSYILDALRKSEQERQRGKVPDIHSNPNDAAAGSAAFNYWPLVTVAVVVVNMGIVGYFWLKQPAPQPQLHSQLQSQPVSQTQPQTQPQPVAVLEKPTANVQPASEPALKQDTQVRAAPVVPAAKTQQPTPGRRQPVLDSTPDSVATTAGETARDRSQLIQPEVIEPAVDSNDWQDDFADEPAPSVGYMPQLEELSPQERQGIPDMTFSSHMYSSIPRFRSIIINGKRLKEGQYYNDDLQVREITETGVILSKGKTLFSVDVLGRWSQ